MNRNIAFLSFCFLFSFLASTELLGQRVQATLRGRLSDTSGAAIPKAEIEVKNTETNVVVRTVSDSAGLFSTPFLNPGSYTLMAKVPGFKTFLRENLLLSVDQTVEADITLEVGGVNEQIVVTAESELLETAKADRGTLVDQQSVAELPTSGIRHGISVSCRAARFTHAR